MAELMARRNLTVFVSYSHNDGEVLQALKRELSSDNVSVWSIFDIGLAELWSERVLAELEAARIYILLLSPFYLESKNALFESGVAYARAHNNEAVVIPVLLSDVHLPPHLATLQYVDGRRATPSEVARRVRGEIAKMRWASGALDELGVDRPADVPVIEMVSEADWNTLTPRLLAYANAVVRRLESEENLPPEKYVLSAVARLLENAPTMRTRRSLFYLLCMEIVDMVHKVSPQSRIFDDDLDPNSEIDLRIGRLEVLPAEQIEFELRQLGINPERTVEAVRAAVRMRQREM